MYFPRFRSFLDSFWWGLMTLTTVGYGDLSPSTFPGKLIGKAYFSKDFPSGIKNQYKFLCFYFFKKYYYYCFAKY